MFPPPPSVCSVVPLLFHSAIASAADITPPVGWRRAGSDTELISAGVNNSLMTKSMVFGAYEPVKKDAVGRF